jgi:hypothetical protein
MSSTVIKSRVLLRLQQLVASMNVCHVLCIYTVLVVLRSWLYIRLDAANGTLVEMANCRVSNRSIHQ